MSSENKHHCGYKMERLQLIRSVESLQYLVLPIFPIFPLSIEICPNSMVRDVVLTYSQALERGLPQLAVSVENVCGPAPWIVRSAGYEDSIYLTNAGGYESRICVGPQELFKTVAEVATSGLTEHARRQLLLSGNSHGSVPLPCFVQPLLNIEVAGDLGRDHSPYIEDSVLDDMESVCKDMMGLFGFEAIDCEWGLETELGFVSATTIMPQNTCLMNVAHTIGFGFSSAQNSGTTATSLVLRPACSEVRLWRGRHLRETAVRRIHLLQVRPAQLDEAHRDRDVLTKQCRDTLTRHYSVLDAGLLMLGAHSSGRMLVATDLMTAWRQYLALATSQQASVALVLVDSGSAEEHAGIMFRQRSITCVWIDTSRIPAAADYAVFDRCSCIVGDLSMWRSIQTESRRELVIPDDCALVFPNDVLLSNGDLKGVYKNALLQVESLQVAPEVRERLLSLSDQPNFSRWVHLSNGAIHSPSLLAAIWRSKYSGHSDRTVVLTKFAESYYRAVQAPNQAGKVVSWLLSKMSIATHLSLLDCVDVRITMALVELEAAMSWIPSRTLQGLLDSATRYLEVSSRDSALLILESIYLINAECERLPIYVEEDAISYLDVLAKVLECDLSIEALLSIRSLDLPISSESLLAKQALSSPKILGRISVYKSLVAVFRCAVSGSEEVSVELKKVNAAYLELREVLCEVELKGVAEQIKGSLIEVYDSSLKALLLKAVDDSDSEVYRRYILVMKSWLQLLRSLASTGGDVVVLRLFDRWLTQWLLEEFPESFNIKDRNWRLEFSSISSSLEASQRYENPHVIHNLLHQYSLASLQLDSLQLPQRVQTLERFCSTFSNRSTKVLRFERELLEIQIPMGTHKASYVFRPREISVEWAEPPDCPSDEIARIIAFEILLQRFRTWMFPTLTVRREEVLGTSILHIRVTASTPKPCPFEHLKLFVIATRFLFDASYDFSYVPNEVGERVADKFNGLEWSSIFTTLIRHRELIEDASQYVALHALPMSSTLGGLVHNGSIRGLLLRSHRRGFEYCHRLINRYVTDLNDSSSDGTRWSIRYESLRQSCLFLAANWPMDSLLYLSGRNFFDAGDDLIAACLLKRSDIACDLHNIIAESSSVLSGISGLIVQHSPEIAVAALSPPLLASRLVRTGVHFRRAKHLLISHFGDQLSPQVLSVLIRPLDTVPWGNTVEIENAINAHLSNLPPVYRFELDKGIDWTTLDSWATVG